VAHLRASIRRATPTAPLRASCKSTYEGIRTRILNFLITGYWLRHQASAQGASVSASQVRAKFEEEMRTRYTATSFRRLEAASHQTVADLEFAIETEMLSGRLLAEFAKAHGDHKNEQAAVPAFNKSIRSQWIPKTDCEPGYIVRDCKEYHE